MQRVDLVDGVVDLLSGRVLRDGVEQRLSRREASVLQHLADRQGRSVSRDELLVDVFGYHPDVASRAVDTVVHRLRLKVEVDPAAPIHVISVFNEGYRFEPAPAPRPSGARLPVPRSTFIGRDSELLLLSEALGGSARVLSIVGPGGVGKTRLAIEAARRAPFDRVDLASLAAVTTEADLVRRVADALGIEADDRRSLPAWMERIGRSLALVPCLLVLDNAEQILDPVRTLIDGLAGVAPEARFLVTTRRPLDLEGEVLLPLASLPNADALALLEQRWSDAGGSPWGPADRDAAEALVVALDGLPLALELAAARASALRPASILGRIDQRFRLLRHGARDATPRHASLRAALDWSWELLSEGERRALAELAAFPASWTREAERDVLTEPACVEELARHSLARLEGGRGDLAVSVRAYAEEHARARGEWDGAILRHARWAVSFAESLSPELEGADLADALDRLQDELPHVLAAERVLQLDPDLVRRAVASLATFFQVRGPADAYVDVLDRVVASGGAGEHHARALRSRALVRRLRGDSVGALADLDAAIPWMADPLKASSDRAMCLADLGRFTEALEALEAVQARIDRVAKPHLWYTNLGAWATQRSLAGHDPKEVELMFREALQAAREHGGVRFEAGFRANLSTLLIQQGRIAEAEHELEAAIDALRALGNERRMATAMMNLAAIRAGQGDLEAADALCVEAEAILEAHGHQRFLGHARVNRAGGKLAMGEPERALELVRSGLEVLKAVGDHNLQYLAEAYHAAILAELDHVDDARAALEAAAAHFGARGGREGGMLAVVGVFVDLAEARRSPERAVELLARAEAALAEDRSGWQDGAHFLARILDPRRPISPR